MSLIISRPNPLSSISLRRYLHSADSRRTARLKRANIAGEIFPTSSNHDAVFAIQHAVFGTHPPVPGKSARGMIRRTEHRAPASDWYPPDLLGKIRSDERRAFKNVDKVIKKWLGNDPDKTAATALTVPTPEKPLAPGTVEFSRHLARKRVAWLNSLLAGQNPQSPEERLESARVRKGFVQGFSRSRAARGKKVRGADRRKRKRGGAAATDTVAATPIDLKSEIIRKSALRTLPVEARRLRKLIRLKFRGKGSPKKGQGKRATGGKKKKK